MQILKRLGLLILPAMILIACEEDAFDDIGTETRDEFLGSWNVLETAGLNHPQNYTVEIVAGSDDNEIVFRGLYNISGLAVNASVYGANIEIEQQSLQGYTIQGNGQANSDFDQLNLNFTVNDGGSTDEVEAVLTR